MYINPNSIPCKYLQGFYVHPDYPGYSVNCEGKVFSYRKMMELKGYVSVYGYREVRIYNKQGIYKLVRVHRLVAYHFVPLPLEFNGNYDLATVDHIDGIKLNNHYSNLDWVPQEENNRRAWRNGLCDNKFRPIVILDKLTKSTFSYPSIAEAERQLCLPKGNITTYFVNDRKGYVANRYIPGYADDVYFINKLNYIDNMIKEADMFTKAYVRPVIIVDKETKGIYKFPSITEAEKQLNLPMSSIGHYLNRNKTGYVADRYICGYEDNLDFINGLVNIEKMIEDADNSPETYVRPIIILDKVTKEIMNFPSIAEAGRFLKISYRSITLYLSNARTGYIADRYICGYTDDINFISRLNDIDLMIKEADNNTRKIRPVICNDVVNNTIIEYPSMVECSREININKTTISSHLIRGSKVPIHGRWIITYKD